jgi:hypothetical protein
MLKHINPFLKILLTVPLLLAFFNESAQTDSSSYKHGISVEEFVSGSDLKSINLSTAISYNITHNRSSFSLGTVIGTEKGFPYPWDKSDKWRFEENYKHTVWGIIFNYSLRVTPEEHLACLNIDFIINFSKEKSTYNYIETKLIDRYISMSPLVCLDCRFSIIKGLYLHYSLGCGIDCINHKNYSDPYYPGLWAQKNVPEFGKLFYSSLKTVYVFGK